MPEQQLIDLAGKPYRFRHGWILLNPGLGTGRRKIRAAETAEEIKAGVRPGGRRAPSPAAPAGPVRFRRGGQLRETRPTRERQLLRGMENKEIARERGGGGGVTTSGLSPSEKADRATQRLTGRNASDMQHRAAAGLHAQAARSASNPITAAHHMRAVKMHRGIAGRTPGKRTRGELALRKTAGSQLADARARRAAHSKLAKRGVTFSTTTELAQRHVPIDPKIPLGSGGRFKKMKSKLAARGARNPGALAAYIGRRAYGRKKFASLGAHGRAHAHANPMEFAMTHQPVSSPLDLVIVRGEGGTAIIRHRNGGEEIGRIRREGDSWVATIAEKDAPPRTHQRSALADVVGTHNKSALTSQHKPASAGAPLQPAPRQTPLMEQFGIPAIRALATPMGGSGDGPRVAKASGSSDNDEDDSGGNGLSPKAKAIYTKLCARGFPKARALAFAKRAENMAGRP